MATGNVIPGDATKAVSAGSAPEDVDAEADLTDPTGLFAGSAPEARETDAADDEADVRSIFMAARCGFAIECATSPAGRRERMAQVAAEKALADVDCLALVAGELELVLADVDLADTTPLEAAYGVCRALLENDLADNMAPAVDDLLVAGTHDIGAVVEALLSSPSIATLGDVDDGERIGQLALDDVLLGSAFLEAVAALIVTAFDGDATAEAAGTAVDTVVAEYADDPRGMIEALTQIPDAQEVRVDGATRSVLEVAIAALRDWMGASLADAIRTIQPDIDSAAGDPTRPETTGSEPATAD